MGRVLSKKQRRLRRETSRKNRIKKMENQDIKGINRKKRKLYIHPKVFFVLKMISICSYPIVYFIYSPLLIICVLYTISLFYFASLTENYHNHTYIKKNHIKINSFDSVVAAILLIITLVGSFSGLNSKQKIPMFKVQNQIVMTLENTGSCLTGTRGIFRGMGMKFGTKEPPKNMPMPSPPDGIKPPKEFSIDDLPIEMLFSMAVSSINTVLIFVIPVSGCITLYLYYRKKQKFNLFMNDVIDDSFPPLTDEQWSKLLSFGCEIEQEEIQVEEN